MELLVNTDAFDRYADTLRRCESIIKSVRNTVVSQRSAMSDRVLRSSGASWQLQEVVNRLDKNKNNVKSMYQAAINIQRQYRNMEERNVRSAGGVSISDDGVTTGWGSESGLQSSSSSSLGFTADYSDQGSDTGFDHLPYLWELLSQAGLAGSFFGTMGSVLTGGEAADTTDNFLEFVENFSEAFGGSGPSFNWGNLLGLDEYNFADDYNLLFGNGQSVGENIAVGARWASFIATGIFNGIDNLTGDREGENNTLLRAIAETFGETAVDIAFDAGAAFLISSAAAACGVALPAVVVGGSVVLVGWAADYICETFFGADLAETVSDFVLDTVDSAVEFASEAIDSAVEFASEALDSAAEFAENACEFIGDAAETVSDTITGWWNRAFA